MKTITKLFIILSLAFVMLVGCTRTYSDGYSEEVSWYEFTYDIVVGKPARKELEPLVPMKLTGDPAIDAKINAFNSSLETENAKIAKHNAGAKKDRERPDNGLLELIGLAMTAVSVGGWRLLVNKRNAEALRELAESGERKARVRYQAAKEAIREDTTTLAKVKKMAAIAEDSIDDAKEIYAKHGNTVDGVKRAYAEIQRKNS